MSRSRERNPDVDPWTLGRGAGAPQHWVGRDLRAWSTGQRYTAALAVVFSLVVVTTSRGPVRSSDDFLAGIGDGAVEDVIETSAAPVGAAPAPEAPTDVAVPPEPASSAAFSEPSPAGPVAAPAGEAAFEPEPSPSPPPAAPSPSPSSPPPQEPETGPTDALPLPLPIR